MRTVTDQYITAYADQLAVDFTKEIFEVMKREEEILKKLTQQNVFKQTDFLNFFVTMQQQQLSFLQAKNQYAADYLTLNYLAGIFDTTVQRIGKPLLKEFVQNTLESSIFLKSFITDSLRLANERQLINYQYKPKIGAYADGGYTSSLQTHPYKNFGLSAGLSLTIPIYDGHQRQMKYEQINIMERSRQTKKEFFVNQYHQQISMLSRQLKAIDLLVAEIRKQIEYAHALIIANNKLMETGDITMRDYVIAINNYLNAQNLLTQYTVNRLRILNQINYWH